MVMANIACGMEPLEDGEIPQGRALYVGNPADRLPIGITLDDVSILFKATPEWSSFSTYRLKEIIDKGQGGHDDRLAAFNYLRNWIHLNRASNRDEGTVTNIMLFARLVLWDEPGSGRNEHPRMNDVLKKLVAWENSYLDEAILFLDDALLIHTESLLSENSRSKRISATLIGHRARAKQLSLLKDMKGRTYEEIDPDHSRRADIYFLYNEAWIRRASKSCVLQMIHLIEIDQYSPTRDVEADTNLLTELKSQYEQIVERKQSLSLTRQKEIVPITGRIPVPSKKGMKERQRSLVALGSVAEEDGNEASNIDEGASEVTNSKKIRKRKHHVIESDTENSDEGAASMQSPHKGRSDITSEIKEQIKLQWEQGIPAERVGKKLGFNKSAIHYCYQEFELGSHYDSKELTAPEKERIKELKEQGKTSLFIAKELKTSVGQIDRYYNRRIKEEHIPNIELTEDDKKKIQSLYEKNEMKPKEIVAALAFRVERPLVISSRQVEAVLLRIKKNKIPSRDLTIEEKSEIIRLKGEGMPASKISERLGVNQSQVEHCNKISHRMTLRPITTKDELKIIELRNNGYSRDRIFREQEEHSLGKFTESQIRGVLEKVRKTGTL